MKPIFIVTLLPFMLLVCSANPINKRTSEHYAAAAQAAVEHNDWTNAAKYWGRAVLNAELGKAPQNVLVVYYYEYGRALGAVCEFAESEKYLLKALDIDKSIGGPYYQDLTELARLNYDQWKFKEAVAYYDALMPALAETNSDEEAPAVTIEILTEYTDTLKKVDRLQDAAKAEERIAKIKEKHPQRRSITERTPYGKYGPKKKN